MTAVDVDESRAADRRSRWAPGLRRPEQAPGEADIVFHASATAAGLDTAIDCAGLEATIVEMSWYGDKPVQVDLGGAFHSRRLKLVSSQVGQVSPAAARAGTIAAASRRPCACWPQPALDALVAEEIAFEDAPRELPRIFAPGARGLAPVIRYPQA